MERIIQLTTDGSHTVAIPKLNSTYHSKHGAIQESLHVFIEAGLYNASIQSKDVIHIVEIGFGTGLNALLTAMEAVKLNKTIYYYSIEPYPLIEAEYQLLNYGEILHQQPLFNAIHEAEWNKMIMINPHFHLYKIHKKIHELISSSTNDEAETPSLNPSIFHLVYYDAFAPTVQPELWTKEVFTAVYNLLAPNGILVTYCSKGNVRRNMQAVGLQVEKIPGPPGKREMVRAYKL